MWQLESGSGAQYVCAGPLVIWYQRPSECGVWQCTVAKADRWLQEEKKFYHQFSIVKYSYLPTDTFRKYVERHVT